MSRIFGPEPLPSVEPATLRDAPVLAEIHAASFHRGWSESEFDDMVRESNTVVHRLRVKNALAGFAVSRIAADEAEILTIAVAASHRGRGYSHTLLHTHMGYLAGRGVASLFLEVEENNVPARKLYERSGFQIVGRRDRYYREAGGKELNALIMRRDLS